MENKIKLKTNKLETIKHTIDEQVIEITPWVEASKAIYIIDECCKMAKNMIKDKNDDSVVLYSTMAQMNMLVAYFTTNLDLEDLDIEEIGKTNLFKWLAEDVMNYEMIKSSIIAGLNMLNCGVIIEQLSNVASIEDLSKAQNEIANYMKNEENSDKINKLIETMLANNPKLASTLNDSIVAGDKENGDKE